MEERRLARARAAPERDGLAAADRQLDVPQRDHVGVAAPYANDTSGSGRGVRADGAGGLTRSRGHAPVANSITRSAASATLRVRHHDDRGAVVVAQARRRQHLLVARVELARRLVGEHERRAARGGGGDRDALLLAARERAGAMVRAAREPEPGERRVGAPARRGAPASRSDATTFSAADSAGHRLSLWKTRRPRSRDRRASSPRQPAERLAEGAHLTRRRLVEAGGQREQGALAAARRAEDGDELARLDPQVETAQRDRLDRPGAEDPEHVVELERRPLDSSAGRSGST